MVFKFCEPSTKLTSQYKREKNNIKIMVLNITRLGYCRSDIKSRMYMARPEDNRKITKNIVIDFQFSILKQL
jgi:hypothetical protein